MGTYSLGDLHTVAARKRPELIAPAAFAALEQYDLLDRVGVVLIDPAFSDTGAIAGAYSLPPEVLANCVIVSGRRAGVERVAACVALATHRIDVNTTVKKLLDVRSASFLPRDRAVELTEMEFGAITPIGAPGGWSLLVDEQVAATPLVVIGSGRRESKLVLKGSDLAALPTATVTSIGSPATRA
ncbi:YbaK/EbsC family protein [Microbacterium sp.]|uniref:YbaK/EbsC family protein n=1 Tax=Microbacterium sp. TaxID=51671 RepID=UPI003C711C23